MNIQPLTAEKSFILILLPFTISLTIVLSFFFQISFLLGGWLFFTLAFFSLGGWFFKWFVLITAGSSFFVFIAGIYSAGTVWLPLEPLAGIAYFGSMFGGRYMGRSRDGFATQRGANRSPMKGVIVAIIILGFVLLLLATPTNVDPIVLWVPALPLGAAGLLFPEINRLIGVKLGMNRSTPESVVVYVFFWLGGLIEPLYLGSEYKYSIVVSIMSLLLFMHLRAVTGRGRGSSLGLSIGSTKS